MDLLDFEDQALYFDEPLSDQAKQCIDNAAQEYSSEEDCNTSENALLRAYFLAPEHPMVLVALYRFYYYRHRLEDALCVADRVIKIFAERLSFPKQWQDLTLEHISSQSDKHMAQVRFYLLALKGSGYLQMRLGDYDNALTRLEKVVDLDEKDRLGSKSLLEILKEKISPRIRLVKG